MDSVYLTEEDAALQRTIREYADNKLKPRASRLDQTAQFPSDAVKEISDLGLFGLAVGEEYGGLSGTRVQISVVLEQLAKADAATALTLMSHIHATSVISRHGSAVVQKRWLPGAAKGESIIAVCLTEPEAGTDLKSMRGSAERSGSDYILNATKTFITNGGYAAAYLVFVHSANTRDELSAFLVPSDQHGVSVGRKFEKLGLRSSSTTEVLFDNVRVPSESRIGADGQGFPIALESVDGARMSTAAQAVGIAQGAFEMLFDYARIREQSGRPIAGHQAVQLRLGDMRVRIDAARALLFRASRAMDIGGPANPSTAASAKVFCTDTAYEVASRSAELAGGYGYMEESSLPRYVRDAKGTQIYDGTNDINRLLIARQLIRKGPR